MLVVLAKLPIKPECREGFIEQTKKLVAQSREESGNLSYNLYQSTENDHDILFVEEWTDRKSFEAHGQTPHYLEYLKIREAMLFGKLEIKIYEVQK